KEALFRADFKRLGVILERSWRSKKTISEIVSNDELDRIYHLAVNNGAYSGKTSGAGAGGFMFFLCEPTEKYRLCELLSKQGGYVAKFSFIKEGAKSWRV
ncbi:TPA: dehydrogenase, partial [Campylobacter upsaliensis]|nr:dehydrogenase [Campylobacter upsaliensis]